MALWNCEGYLLSGLGISPGHTVYAPSQGALDGWAQGKAKGSFSQYSYTRPDKQSINAWAPGSCHVAIPYTDATAIDYVMFKNNDVDASRWFYGAVQHREYVNINSTRLWFTLDYWLTFHEELRNGIGACLIERSHIKQADDWNGAYPKFANLNPEPFVPNLQQHPFKDWNEQSAQQWDVLRPRAFVLYATTDEMGSGEYPTPPITDMPTACYTKVCNTIGELHDLISAFNSAWPVPYYDTSNPESIFAVTYVPPELAAPRGAPKHEWLTNIPNRGDIMREDGLAFHNAKCFSYPYMFASAKTAAGQELVLKFEECGPSGRVNHFLQGAGGISAKYRYGVNQDDTGLDNTMRYITLPEYPQLPITGDTFAQWQASQGLANGIGAAIGTMMVMVGLAALPETAGASGALAGAGAGLASAGGAAALTNVTLGASLVMDRFSNINQAAHFGDMMVGKATPSDAVAFQQYRVAFYLNSPSIKDLTAVDDFFDAYGYSVMTYAVPDLHVRQYFTYVKTANANIRAAVPMEGITQACTMLNNGCTFWDITAGDIGVKRSENPDA